MSPCVTARLKLAEFTIFCGLLVCEKLHGSIGAHSNHRDARDAPDGGLLRALFPRLWEQTVFARAS